MVKKFGLRIGYFGLSINYITIECNFEFEVLKSKIKFVLKTVIF